MCLNFYTTVKYQKVIFKRKSYRTRRLPESRRKLKLMKEKGKEKQRKTTTRQSSEEELKLIGINKLPKREDFKRKQRLKRQLHKSDISKELGGGKLIGLLGTMNEKCRATEATFTALHEICTSRVPKSSRSTGIDFNDGNKVGNIFEFHIRYI